MKLLISFFLIGMFLSSGTGLAITSPCFECHDEQKGPWEKNPHRTVKVGCDVCHGVGEKHIESMEKKDIINPSELKPESIVKICGNCHFGKHKLDKVLWEESIHSQSDFTCLNCHDPHKVQNSKLLIEKEVKTTCYACHTDIEESFDKSLHGKNELTCVDCHLPHGSENVSLLHGNGAKLCQTCHEEGEHHFISDKHTLKMDSLKCIDCHLGHSEEERRLKTKKEDLCSNCHKGVY